MGGTVTLKDVRAGYGRLEALHGISAVFPAGVFSTILGPNGAGKTTLLRVLAGQLTPTTGEVLWSGRRMAGRSPLDLTRHGMTYIPHLGGVFDELTVAENLRLFSAGASSTAAPALFPVLERKYRQYAGTLSGGEHQMLALSRAFMRQPEILLIDEAGAGLATEVTARVYNALAGLAATGTTVVTVDQYAGEALKHARVVYGMRRGDIVFAGEPVELSGGNLTRLIE